jgi:hypothetical protein
MKSKPKRSRLFVDPEVQGALVTRCLVYWCVALFVVFVALLSPDFIFATLGLVSPTSPSIWVRYTPALILAGSMTPIMVLDLLRCTNKFAGPMVRTRRFLRHLANGDEVTPIKFRRGDYWRGYADDLNAVMKRIQALENQVAVMASREEILSRGQETNETSMESGRRDQEESELVFSH